MRRSNTRSYNSLLCWLHFVKTIINRFILVHPVRGAKNPCSSERGFFICAVRHNIIWPKVNIISSNARISFFISRHKWTRLRFAQMKLRQAANDVMLRINDVALRANGTEHLSHIGATILHPNTKVLVNQGLFVFLGVKNTTLSPLHLCPDLLVLKARLDIGKNVIDC